MQNINPWIISAAVMSFSGIIFRLWLGNSMVSLLLAVIFALVSVPLLKVIQAKGEIEAKND